MKEYILLAALAAIMTPTGAIAQQHHPARRGNAQARNDRRAVRANREVVRSDHRTIRANRQAMHSDHRTIRADRQVVRSDRNDRRRNANSTRSAYVAPYRHWSYRPVTVGYRLQPNFYGSRYYISDYGAYHLQAPHNRWLRWIRYGNDLLLVNIRTGRVLQVIHYQGW